MRHSPQTAAIFAISDMLFRLGPSLGKRTFWKEADPSCH